jgi:hypothetical protein
LVAEWRQAGSPRQPGIDWPSERWVEYFPAHKRLFRDDLPKKLDRRAVVKIAATASSSPAQAVRAFLAGSAWGYGRVGYGPWRVAESLVVTPDAPQRLHSVAMTLMAGTAVTAYSMLAKVQRIYGLGPAFGTKFLYFTQPADRRPRALILDSQIGAWLRSHAGWPIDVVPWSSATYSRYLDQMHTWATSLDVGPEALELCMFRDMVGANSQWRW